MPSITPRHPCSAEPAPWWLVRVTPARRVRAPNSETLREIYLRVSRNTRFPLHAFAVLAVCLSCENKRLVLFLEICVSVSQRPLKAAPARTSKPPGNGPLHVSGQMNLLHGREGERFCRREIDTKRFVKCLPVAKITDIHSSVLFSGISVGRRIKSPHILGSRLPRIFHRPAG